MAAIKTETAYHYQTHLACASCKDFWSADPFEPVLALCCWCGTIARCWEIPFGRTGIDHVRNGIICEDVHTDDVE